MQFIAFRNQRSRKAAPALGIILGVILLLLVIGSYYLVQARHSEQRITPKTVERLEEVPSFMRHDTVITSIAFNPQQTEDISFVSSDANGMIKLWHLQTDATTAGATEVTKSAPENEVSVDVRFAVRAWKAPYHAAALYHATALSRDGKQLVSIGDQGAANLWNLAKTATIFDPSKDSQPEDKQSVLSVSLSTDGQVLASGRADGTIKLWNWKTGEVLHRLKAHDGGVSVIAFSPDGQTLASGSTDRTGDGTGDGTVKLWNWKTGKFLKTLKTGTSGVAEMVFSRDGKTLATRNYDGTVTLWAGKDGRAIRTLPDPSYGSITFSLDGQTFVTDSSDGIKLWNPIDGTERLTLKEGSSPFAFSSDSQTLASGSEDGIKLWNLRDGAKPLTLKDGRSPFAFSPDGKTLASTSDNGTMKLWNVDDGRLLIPFQGRETDVTSLTFSPKGETLASAGSAGITLWDPGYGLASLSVPMKEGVSSIAFSPDGQTLVTLDNGSQTIKLLPLDYRKKLATQLTIDLKEAFFVAFSADNQQLILANNTQIKRVRISDRHEIWTTKAELGKPFYNVTLSPNAQLLAAGGEKQPIQLWDLTTDKPMKSLLRDSTATYLVPVAFSPDGQTLAVVNNDGITQLWNLKSRKIIRRLPTNYSWAVMDFSPDGQLLASGSSSGEIQLWNLHTGKKLRTLKGHASWVTALAFSPDGQTLASGSSDQTIKLWRVNGKGSGQ